MGPAGSVPSKLYRTRRQPTGIAIGELTSDHNQDLVVAQDATNTLSETTGPGEFAVYAGNGDGTFTRLGSGGRTEEAVYRVVLADLDGDGRQDVVSLLLRKPVVVVARGDGHGHLLPALRFPAGAVPVDVVVADLNHDGMPDLATAAVGNAVRVLLAGPRAAPVLTSLSPREGTRRRSRSTLTGARFGARRAAGLVTFGGVPASDYVSWSSTRIQVEVPVGSPTGPVKVRVRTVAGRSVAQQFQVCLRRDAALHHPRPGGGRLSGRAGRGRCVAGRGDVVRPRGLLSRRHGPSRWPSWTSTATARRTS